MISSVEIKGLRGIQQGRLDDLTPLVVLVGPNGSGKSTILASLLLGGSSVPANAFERISRSLTELKQAARWIVYKAEESGVAEFSVTTSLNAKLQSLLPCFRTSLKT